MKAVILAGGKGTRLGKLSKEIPKPMIKISGKPLLEHQIDLLHQHGIKEIYILTNHLSEVIENYTTKWAEVKVIKEPEPLGTAGAVKALASNWTEDFLVLYGDMMINIDLDAFINFHKRKKGSASLVIQPSDHPDDCDLLEIDNTGRITAIYPKPRKNNLYLKNLDNACLYILSPTLLQQVEGFADFAKDLFPKIIKTEQLYGYRTAEYIKDIGTPERLEEVQQDFVTGKVARLHRQQKRKAIFLDRDGVINQNIDHITRIEDFHLYPWTTESLRRINNSEFLAIIITNQSVIARGMCSFQQLDNIHKKMETSLGKKRAKIDGIYFCPHHPDFSGPCNCRKPKLGLIRQAAADHNIDLSKSFLIGDADTDILCGKNAGIKTIGVRTGYGCPNSQPDLFVDNLKEAVQIILSDSPL